MVLYGCYGTPSHRTVDYIPSDRCLQAVNSSVGIGVGDCSLSTGADLQGRSNYLSEFNVNIIDVQCSYYSHFWIQEAHYFFKEKRLVNIVFLRKPIPLLLTKLNSFCQTEIWQ